MNFVTTMFCFALGLAFGPLAIAHPASKHETREDQRYGLELHCATRALVFIDGKFLGQLSPKGPLKLVLKHSTVQLRATEAGYLDLIHEVKLTAGKMLKLGVHMPKIKSSWPVPKQAILLQVGQTTRGRLKKDEEVRFLIPEQRLPHRMIQGYSAMAEFKLIGPNGEAVELKRIPRPAGTPGKWFFEYKGIAIGNYTLLVRSKKGHYAFELGVGLPALVDTAKPSMKGRRKAPAGPR